MLARFASGPPLTLCRPYLMNTALAPLAPQINAFLGR